MLTGKTILITGASSGIGKATAIHFYKHGWNVIATMRSPEKDTEFIERFASMFLKGPEWTRTVWDLEEAFIRDNLYNSLKEIMPLLEKLKKEKG